MNKFLLSLLLVCSVAFGGSWIFIASSSPPFSDTQSVNFVSATPSYVDLGTTMRVQPGDKFMLSWFGKFPNSQSAQQAIISTESASGIFPGWVVGFFGSPRQLYFEENVAFPGAQAAISFTNVNYSDGGWHCFVLLNTGGTAASTFHLYVDKLDSTPSVSADTLSGALIYTANTFIGGRDSSHANPLNGNVNNISFATGGNYTQTDVNTYCDNADPSQPAMSGQQNWWRMVGPSDSTNSYKDYVGGSTYTGSGTTIQSDVSHSGLVTDGLVFQKDPAKYNGTSFGGAGCGNLTWVDLISSPGLDGTISNCVTGWATSPDSLAFSTASFGQVVGGATTFSLGGDSTYQAFVNESTTNQKNAARYATFGDASSHWVMAVSTNTDFLYGAADFFPGGQNNQVWDYSQSTYANVWTNVAMSFHRNASGGGQSATSAAAYGNVTPLSTSAGQGPFGTFPSSAAFTIGGEVGGNTSFGGSMGLQLFYTRALGQDEIRRNCNAYAATYGVTCN